MSHSEISVCISRSFSTISCRRNPQQTLGAGNTHAPTMPTATNPPSKKGANATEAGCRRSAPRRRISKSATNASRAPTPSIASVSDNPSNAPSAATSFTSPAPTCRLRIRFGEAAASPDSPASTPAHTGLPWIVQARTAQPAAPTVSQLGIRRSLMSQIAAMINTSPATGRFAAGTVASRQARAVRLPVPAASPKTAELAPSP